jgi:hypothetical protein
MAINPPNFMKRWRDERPQRRVPDGYRPGDDLGQPDRIDIYYGMADSRIGVARLDVPEHQPTGEPPTAKVRRE